VRAACKFPKHESSEKKNPGSSRGQHQPKLRVSTFRSSPTEHWGTSVVFGLVTSVSGVVVVAEVGAGRVHRHL
jgi:hypothetical protein